MKSPSSFSSHQLPLLKFDTATSEIVNTRNLRYQPAKTNLRSLISHLISLLAGRKEPQIRRGRDRAGNLCFRVFDPISGEFSVFNSEKEVRVWLEQRYYSDRH